MFTHETTEYQSDDDYAAYLKLANTADQQLTRARIEAWLMHWQQDIRPEAEAELRSILERA